MTIQRPARVSTILRSSAWKVRPNGTPGRPARAVGTGRRRVPADGGRRAAVALVWSVGAHAASPSREVAAVRPRNISSRPSEPPDRSSRSTTRSSAAIRPTTPGSASTTQARAGPGHRRRRPARAARPGGRRRWSATVVPPRLSSSSLEPIATIRPRPIMTRSSATICTSCSRWLEQQHGAAAVGEAAQQPAHPVDALRVEAVGRLVEDQHLRLAQQGGRDAEALAHAEGVVAHAAAGLLVGEADEGEHLLDAGLRDADRHRRDAEHLAAGAAGVLGRGVEHDADLAAGVVQLAVGLAEDRGAPGRGGGQPGHHPHRGGLARRRWVRGSRRRCRDGPRTRCRRRR